MQKFLILFCVLILTIFFCCFSKQEEQKVILKFSSWGSQSEIALIEPLLKEFEHNNPNIKIEFLHIPQNYFQKLHLLFASNLAPDIIFINNHYIPKYAEKNLLEDLTSYIDKQDYFSKPIECLTYNGRIYAVPRDVSNLVIYYNKTLFDKYNIPYPKQNWTLEEYINIGKTFAKNGIWGISFETDAIFWLPYLMSNGAGILSDDGKQLIINSEKALNSLDLYADLANKYHIAPQKSDSASLTMAQLFLQQKLAMHLSGRWLVPKYRKEAIFDWDIAQFPQGVNGSVVNIDASGYAISKTSKHKTEALKFIEFITSKDSLEYLTQSGLIIPARVDVANSNIFLDNKKPLNAKAFIDTIETGKITPVNTEYQLLIDNLNKKLEPLFLNKNKARELKLSSKE